jgi:hypothetical protein
VRLPDIDPVLNWADVNCAASIKKLRTEAIREISFMTVPHGKVSRIVGMGVRLGLSKVCVKWENIRELPAYPKGAIWSAATCRRFSTRQCSDEE